MVNQKQSEQISKSSRRGIKQSALNGNYTGSFAPYGYKKAVIDGKKKLLIDEEAAGHVKLIFDLYVNQKHGEKAVTLYLNEQNIPSPKKRGPWGLTTVQRILQNEVYTGSLVFNKYTNETYYSNIENMHDRRKKLVQRDPSEWIRLEEKTHEAIIDDDTFQRAQEIRLVRGGGKRGGQRVYKNVFAKLIFCQHCSSAMVTMTAKQQEKYRYLMCSRRRRMGEHGCRNGKWIPYYDLRDELIGWIIAQLEELIDDRNGTSEIIVKKVKERSADRDTEKAMKKLSKQLEDARRMLFELRRQKMLGDVDETQYNYEKEMYEKEISTLESKHAGMSTQLEKQRNIEKELDTLQAGLKELKSCDMSNVDELRIILSKLVKNITVDENGNVDVYTLLGKLGEGR
ncbi:recombinase-like zinc beta ribbon protein [Paenibacillus methanolicus]|uniref:Recombinase-like zinc beta ribbon protein n=2 Tax=Paenibacillus methanolicus TaxID=582686 RepID=A0A5S5BRZ3_9BACL|nr:recombinase-like zinc beta ribbon protein [Paenibacillus methanolicus]